MFYKAKVRMEFQRIIAECMMGNNPSISYLTNLIMTQGIKLYAPSAKRLGLEIRDAVFFCIERTSEELKKYSSFSEIMDLDNSYEFRAYGDYRKIPYIDSEERIMSALGKEYSNREKPWN